MNFHRHNQTKICSSILKKNLNDLVQITRTLSVNDITRWSNLWDKFTQDGKTNESMLENDPRVKMDFGCKRSTTKQE